MSSRFDMFFLMTSVPASKPVPIDKPTAPQASNHASTVALVIAIVGFLVTLFPVLGAFIGSPEDLAGLIVGIIGIVAAFRSGSGKVKAIVATVLAAASLVGMVFGDGWLW
jgi:uncharacterized membrane protein